MITRRILAAVALACSTALLGCAGHESRVESSLAALDRGQEGAAVAELNDELDVDREEQLPPMEGDAALPSDRASLT